MNTTQKLQVFCLSTLKFDSFEWSDYWSAAKYMEAMEINAVLLQNNIIVGRTLPAFQYRFVDMRESNG